MKEDWFVLFLIVALAFHLLLLRLNNKKFGINLCSSVYFCTIVYYDLVPLLLYYGLKVNTDSTTYQIFLEEILSAEYEQFFFSELVKTIFIVSFFMFYQYETSYCNFSYKVDEKRLHLNVSVFAWIVLIMGGSSLIIYIRQFGDILTFFQYAEYIRSFSTENADLIGRAVILLVPARMIVVAPILFYCLLLNKGFKNLCITIAFIISLILSIIFLLFNSGKTGIITFAVVFFVTFAKRYSKHRWLLLITTAIISIPILGLLDSTFKYLSTNVWIESSTSSTEYIGQFSYVYANMDNLKSIIDISGIRYGIDMITGILDIIPGVTFQATYEFTSQSHFGLDWMSEAGVPIDYITLSYIQFGLMGLVIFAIILGYFCFILNNAMSSLPSSFEIIKNSLLICMFNFFINSDTSVLVSSQFLLTICAAVVLFSLKPTKDQIPFYEACA